MISFVTNDGLVFHRKTPQGIVRAMRKLNWHRDEPKRTYMLDVIDRVEQISGHPFTGKLTADRFLVYLHDLGYGILRTVS